MNARMIGGNAWTPAAAQPRTGAVASRRQDRSHVRSHAKRAEASPAPSCKPNPTGPCRPLAPCYRCAGAHRPLAVPRCESLHPSALPEPSPRRRITDASIALALSNSPRGLSMEKTARVFICQPPKSFPVKDLRANPSQNEAKQAKPMILRSYTLCEVDNGDGQLLPVPNRPIFTWENRPEFGRSVQEVFGRLICGRRKKSGSTVIPGLSAMGGTPSHHTHAPRPGQKRPANPLKRHVDKSNFVQSNFGGAA
jgi:hypothetical protein